MRSHSETQWWNERVICCASIEKLEVDRRQYSEVRKIAKRAVAMAQGNGYQEAAGKI